MIKHNSNHEERMMEARGWPMMAMWAERDLNAPAPANSGPTVLYLGFGGGAPSRSTSVSALSPLLPLHPIWSGFIIDTISLAILYRLIYLTLAVPRRFLVEISRMRRGCCISCGYQLDFDFRAGCPECGWRRSSEAH